MSAITPNETRGHWQAQENPPTEQELAVMHGFTDDLHDWLRERLDTDQVTNLDGSVLGFVLTGFGDVSISVTPTGFC